MDEEEGPGKIENAVKADTTPAAASGAVATAALPAGTVVPRIGDSANGEDTPSNKKLESGSGSGDQDGNFTEDCPDHAARKRKTRRGKPKHRKLKPYSKQQLSYHQRLRCRSASATSTTAAAGGVLGRSSQSNKTGRQQPPAPYNTTQFLMEDHSDIPDLEKTTSVAFQKPIAPPRTRDSSFSIDSDEDYFYSSPEDEEEFLTKEFSSAYEDLHAERLGTLTKSELIQEYVQLEAKVELLTKRLRGKSANNQNYEDVEGGGKKPPTSDNELAKKLKLCQQRIDDLLQQNEQLRRENETLRAQRRSRDNSPVYSVDSDSDSTASNGNGSVTGAGAGTNNACSCSSSRSSSSSSASSSSSRNAEAEEEEEEEEDGAVAAAKESSVETGSSDSSNEISGLIDTSVSSNTTTTTTDVSNGHATPHEIEALPT